MTTRLKNDQYRKHAALLLISFLWLFSLAFRPAPEPVSGTYYINSQNEIHFIKPYEEGPRPKGNFTSLTLPLKRAQNLLLLEARVDGQIGNFIIDFGAPYLVLNSTYFRNYATLDGLTAGGITGTGESVRRKWVKKLELTELYYDGLEADVADLGHIENKRGIKIHGLLGLNLFTQFDVEIDVRKNVIKLHRLERSGDRINSTPADMLRLGNKVPFNVRANVMVMNVNMGGETLRFTLDTGAEVNVLDNDIPERALEQLQINKRMLLGGSGSTQVEVLGGTIRKLSLGSNDYLDMNAIITDLDLLGKSYGFSIDGMLGYDFLAQGITSINFKKEEITQTLYKKPTE